MFERLLVPPRFTIIAIAGALSVASFAQDTTPATPDPVPPAEVPETTEKPAAATPELRVTQPKLMEVADPNATDPFLPNLLFPPRTDQLYVPPFGETPPGSNPPSESVPNASLGPHPERIYRVGKFVIKYGTDVRKRSPKLPTEEKLAASTVALLEVQGKLYQIGRAHV